VLVIAVTTFATIPTLIMIIEKCTGGSMKKSTEDHESHGKWPADALFPLYCVCGVCYGMVEVVKRVIPRDIVGGDVDKLRQIDSLVSWFLRPKFERN
jgi:hypothetical protein